MKRYNYKRMVFSIALSLLTSLAILYILVFVFKFEFVGVLIIITIALAFNIVAIVKSNDRRKMGYGIDIISHTPITIFLKSFLTFAIFIAGVWQIIYLKLTISGLITIIISIYFSIKLFRKIADGHGKEVKKEH